MEGTKKKRREFRIEGRGVTLVDGDYEEKKLLNWKLNYLLNIHYHY